MFMHMLGYPTHFGQMEAVQLVAAPGFTAKRVGYLALAVLVDERQEVLMLVTNSIKTDLGSKDQYVVGLALCALGNVASRSMARDLAPDVARLTAAPSAYIRKKAALAAVRVLDRAPEVADTFADAPAALLADRHHGVLLGGAALARALAGMDPAMAAQYAVELPAGLTRLLRGLAAARGGGAEHDVGGVNDPFLQVALLRLLRDLAATGKVTPTDADAIADAVAAVAAAVDAAAPAGAAVLYEAARCALTQATGTAGDAGSLRPLAVSLLGGFLASRDADRRYVALDALARLAAGAPAAVQRHRATVVACVRDGDASIRRRALELVCALATRANAAALTKELTDYLAVTDPDFRPELAGRLATLIAAHATDAGSHFDAWLRVAATPGAALDAAHARRLVVLVSNAPAVCPRVVGELFAVLHEGRCPDDGPLRGTALWFVGEYADALVAAPGGPSPDTVAAVLASYAAPAGAVPAGDRAAALTALAKLAARCPTAAARAAAVEAASAASRDVEEQTRAVEYGALLAAAPALAAAVLERVPPLDPAAHAASVEALPPPADGAGGGEGDLIGDLLALDVGGEGGSGAPSAAAPPVDALADLLGGSVPVLAPAAAEPSSGRAALPADLFGEVEAEVEPLAPIATAPPAPAAPLSSSSPTQHTTVALDDAGLTVTLSFSKPDPDPAVTRVDAAVAWAGPGVATAVSLQAAVPKYAKLRLEPASGDVAAPGVPVAQALHVSNGARGDKPLALRLRVAWTPPGGAARVEMVEVKGLPASL